jgi:predicted Zn finger-like uncharacterized protein
VEIGSMHISCPHCTTSYAIDPATLGAAGRTVRCSRCKEVWLARPEDATETVPPMPAMAAAGRHGIDAAEEWDALAREDTTEAQQAPHVDSPSISGDWPAEDTESDWASAARDEADDTEFEGAHRSSWFDRFRPSALPHPPRLPFVNLAVVCTAMSALVLALLFWRVDVVRLLPQTAAFYELVGMDVNLRGLLFKDVRITSENVEGKPLLVIEGAIVGQGRVPMELPRLRFSVRDAQGTEIYAWNTVLDQSLLKPGERAWFKTRLASPPPEGRNIDIRFFNRRDLAGGHA